MSTKIEKTDQEWREQLSPAQYEILRHKGTEPPFTGSYVHTKDDGIYRCAGCGAELFSSDAKFDSGTGWPSFTEPGQNANIEVHEDRSHGMVRTEVTCGSCGGHLGHVFPDGPGPGAASTPARSISTRASDGACRHPSGSTAGRSRTTRRWIPPCRARS
jgi:peptide-methionine (R)-S-oxide reductase